MTDQRIIYPTDDGGIAIIIPAPEFVLENGIKAVAVKDVPPGKPYKIINASDIPADRTFRDAWEYVE